MQRSRFETGSRQIVANTSEPRLVAFDGGDVAVGALEDVRRLAAWRGARVKDAHSVVRVEKSRGQLGAMILDRKHALGKPGDLTNAARRVDDDAFVADRAAVESCSGKIQQCRLASRAPAIDTKRQRRMLVAGPEDFAPRIGIARANRVDPPLRIGVTRLVIRGRSCIDRLPIAQVAAQHRVDKTPCGRKTQDDRGIDGIGDDRMRRCPPVAQLIQRDAKQHLQLKVFYRPLEERLQ